LNPLTVSVRTLGGSPQLGAPGPGLERSCRHQDKHGVQSGHAKKEVGVGRGRTGASVTMMIMLFIVLSRNKLRIPLEGTYS
jgi:hypothetical protein